MITFKGAEILAPVLLAGIKTNLPPLPQNIRALWGSFMPLLKTIPGRTDTLLYAVQIYNTTNGSAFTGELTEMWAGVSVEAAATLQQPLELCSLPGGLYARFLYRGLPSGANAVFQEIFNSILPKEGYLPLNLPHFQVMGAGYSNTSPNSEEEFYIPVEKG